MISRKVTVLAENGLHFRPVNTFVAEAAHFESSILLSCNGTEINAKSMISLLSARIKYGSEITIIADGPDEREAVKRMAALLEGEDPLP